MTGKVTGKASGAKASKANTLTITDDGKQSHENLVAKAALSSAVANGSTAKTFAIGGFGEVDLTAAVAIMREKVAKIQNNDMSEVEATLTAQAVALDAIFNGLARRAALNMGQYMNAAEIYLRLALKAQSQCRATLETLAEIKHPKTPTFVQQQNVAYQQQVNNENLTKQSRDGLAHGKPETDRSKLLEDGTHGSTHLDTGTAAKASRINPTLETVGAVNRGQRLSKVRPRRHAMLTPAASGARCGSRKAG